MPDEALTELERRNLKLVDEWATTWNQPGGSSEKLVNQLYADATEVRGPLQANIGLKSGESKAGFLAVEQAAANGPGARLPPGRPLVRNPRVL